LQHRLAGSLSSKEVGVHGTNHFLGCLAGSELDLMRDRLELVTLRRDHRLAEVDRPVEHAVLPLTSIVSVITVMKDGRLAESRTIGREGGFGLLHALGSATSFERAIVQVAGQAYRIPLRALQDAAARSPDLTRAIVRHAQATMVQDAQFIACNTFHHAPARLCRWLLMTQDRLGSDVLPLTQEHLAIMLGVQRTTVTALASALQDAGAISYSRGRIMVRDRERLRRGACECYETLAHSVRQILTEPGACAGPLAERA
jgi:CRP-like cAMP-binding protein